MLKGLQASGKSSWAKQYCFEHPEFVRISKDDIRKEFPGLKEGKVIEMETSYIENVLANGGSVVSDNTNLNPIHERRFRKIVDTFNEQSPDSQCTFEVNDSFLSVSLEECIERDRNRENSVGAKVITDTHNKWLKKYTHTEGLPLCVLIDIDGSIAQKGDRDIYDYSKVILDTVIEPVATLVRYIHHGCCIGECWKDEYIDVIFFSGRDDDSMEQTKEWLKKNNIPFDGIFMRRAGDRRDDAIVKREMFNEHINGKYNVLFSVDDRPRITKLWKELGVFCLDVYQDIDRKEF